MAYRVGIIDTIWMNSTKFKHKVLSIQWIESDCEMFSKAIVSFLVVAVAVAEGPQVGLQMPPILPSFARPLSPQVVGGKEAPEGAYPFIVSLQVLSQHFCAGSILNETWIVTAGHCCDAAKHLLSLLSIKAGKHNITKNETNEQTVSATKMYIHEKYGGDVGPYDICLIQLKSPFKLNGRVQTIELPTPESEPTGEAWLCGWGSTSTSRNPIMPDKLQHVQLEYLNRSTCHEAVKRLTGSSPVHETNVCTAPKSKPTSACSGDSGGPLFSRNGQKPVLTGIASWAIMPCGTADAPSVYARVSKFNDWISQKMGNNPRPSPTPAPRPLPTPAPRPLPTPSPRPNGSSRLGPSSLIVLIVLSFLARYA